MKKIILIVLLVLPLLLGQVVIRDSSAFIAWDQVTPTGGDMISYEVFIAPLGDYTSMQSVGQTELLEMDVAAPTEGDWVIGVRTVRTIIAGGEVLYSNINWSDVNGLATPAPFFLKYYAVPAAPGNLRVQ